jgi:hypothetical protein
VGFLGGFFGFFGWVFLVGFFIANPGASLFLHPCNASHFLVPPSWLLFFLQLTAFSLCYSDSNPLLSVVGKCVVLEYKEYTMLRPTQYTEGEVFVCESLFDEGKRLIRPLTGGLKKYVHSKMVGTNIYRTYLR